MPIRRRNSLRICLLAVCLAALPARAEPPADAEAEIEYLLQSVGESDCIFIRNGREYPADKARDHLQMKRQRGRRYYDTTGEFIERIASHSSWSGRDYRVRCGNKPAVTARRWFHDRLQEYHALRATPDAG